jgi:UDP-galactopyranose mutase
MPFARNESTRFISPTKTPEFLAAGLPAVSTPITDVVRDWGPREGSDGLVEIAAEPAAFAEALQRVLERPRAGWLKQVDRRLSQLSWDRTWAEMQGLIATAQRGAARAEALVGTAATGRSASRAMVRSAP